MTDVHPGRATVRSLPVPQAQAAAEVTNAEVTRAEPRWRIGIDTGGTFSDLVATSPEESWYLKVPSTPPHFERGFLDALRRLDVPLSDVAVLAHGTTVTTN